VARIAGVNIPVNKRTEIGLTYIFGIGHSTAKQILVEAGVDPSTQVKDLTEDEVMKLRTARSRVTCGANARRTSNG
jgi:small subunit ribosomal protein S13